MGRFACEAWDRPNDAPYLGWRYQACPAQEAALAVHGPDVVASMFAMRRTYLAGGSEVECLEPYDWFADDVWRPLGAGLRVVKHLMKGPRPILALGGTDAAKALFLRLGFTEIAVATRFNLPRRGRYFTVRGRHPLFALAFDLLGRPLYRPSRRPETTVQLERTKELSPEIVGIAREQQRFSLMRLPDVGWWRWLSDAPPSMGTFLAFHVTLGGRLIGWITARVFSAGGLKVGAIQELFLRDDAVDFYQDTVRAVSVALDEFDVDVISTVTSCPHTTDALRRLRFRIDEHQSLFSWWPGGAAPQGAALADGGHAEWAFFPVPSAAEAASLTPRT